MSLTTIPVPDGLTPNQKTMIDEMPLDEMHDMRKYATPGFFRHGDPMTEYFRAVMAAKRAADPARWVDVSKPTFRPLP